MAGRDNGKATEKEILGLGTSEMGEKSHAAKGERKMTSWRDVDLLTKMVMQTQIEFSRSLKFGGILCTKSRRKIHHQKCI